MNIFIKICLILIAIDVILTPIARTPIAQNIDSFKLVELMSMPIYIICSTIIVFFAIYTFIIKKK